SRGRDIDPTPVVGTLGIVERLDRRPPGATLVENGRLLLLGSLSGDLGGWRWAAGAGAPGDRLPALDLGAHAALLALVVSLVSDGILTGVHGVSDGGLGVALGEMAVRSGVGFRVTGLPGHAELFSEAPSRVVVCALPDRAGEVARRAGDAGVAVTLLGGSGGDRLVVDGLVDVALAEAREAWRTTIPRALGAAVASL